ncbi:MAG: bifunctional phosphopantothenoylcysteine decarboxylase/phosphopantothenate--cysteine ligase CoaBC [bacterium]
MAGQVRPLRAAPRVLLGVTGGIAAYKSLELVRLMRRTGWDPTAVLTRSALRFVGRESFAALTGNPVAWELFPRKRPPRKAESGPVEHVDLATRSNLVVVAPATANIIGKLAAGIADDLLSTLLLAVPASTRNAGRLLFAPAMNSNMWDNPAVRANIERLEQFGCRFVEPGSGELACGTSGAGRMAEPAAILEACRRALEPAGPSLAGLRVTVTAGRTEEPLDPVRVITNRSSGLMGCEIARAAAAAGARVRLIAGALSVPPPPGVAVVRAATAATMQAAVLKHLSATDVLVMCAAVADYRPRTAARAKLHDERLELHLERTPNILAAVARTPHRAAVVGFSQDDSLDRARAKLRDYRLDLIVANPAGTAGSGAIRPTLLVRGGRPRRIAELTKPEFASLLVREIAALARKDKTNAAR